VPTNRDGVCLEEYGRVEALTGATLRSKYPVTVPDGLEVLLYNPFDCFVRMSALCPFL
jgi:hypothetical protein